MSNEKPQYESLEALMELSPEVFDDLVLQTLNGEEEFVDGSFIPLKVQFFLQLHRKQNTVAFTAAVKKSIDRLVDAGKLARYGKGEKHPSVNGVRWQNAPGHSVYIATTVLRDKAVAAIEEMEQKHQAEIKKRDDLIADAKRLCFTLSADTADRETVHISVETLEKLLLDFKTLREAAHWLAANKPGTPVPDWVDQAVNRIPCS